MKQVFRQFKCESNSVGRTNLMASKNLKYRIFVQVADKDSNSQTSQNSDVQRCSVLLVNRQHEMPCLVQLYFRLQPLQKFCSGCRNSAVDAAYATLHEYGSTALTQDSPQKPCDQA